MFAIRVQAEDFDIAAEQKQLCAGRPDIGAIVTFTGLCRDEQGTLAAFTQLWKLGIKYLGAEGFNRSIDTLFAVATELVNDLICE